MNYRNTEMKLDQIVSYLNEEKINLAPPFQRGHVWKVGVRRKLMANIVQGRPIPAIFLYKDKEADGSRYSYNILDGKQRLESLILFVGSDHPEFKINKWDRYFFSGSHRKDVGFSIQLPGGKTTFAKLDADTIADFREYAIPTIEITLTDASHLDEIINLFVDINQQGVAVNRFDIVKAMSKNNFTLSSVFDLIALKERRGQDLIYKPKSNDITRVLKRLKIVASMTDPKSQVDRMWERLLEIALFFRDEYHRKPADILKAFISAGRERLPRLKGKEIRRVRQTFAFLWNAYRNSRLGSTALATDQTHFYTLITTLGSLSAGDLTKTGFVDQLTHFGTIIDGTVQIPDAKKRAFKRYMELSGDRTTDAPRRKERQARFMEILSSLAPDSVTTPAPSFPS